MTETPASEAAPIALIVTVGGSPNPVISAIRSRKARVVWFVVSDGANGQASSAGETAGIVAAIGWTVESANHAVPSDDADAAMKRCAELLRDLRRAKPDHDIVVDYTGGTKSMAGGLMWAGLEAGVTVQFMEGLRSDLNRVEDGSERPRVMTADTLITARTLDRVAALFEKRDYAAALAVAADLKRLSRGPIARLAGHWQELCAILDHWDRFHHKEAARRAESAHDLGSPAADVLERLGLIEPLRKLAATRDSSRPSWLHCADLWLNAQRSAERGRTDDAVARLYRLTEATVQAQLWHRHQIPNPVPTDCVPVDLANGVRRVRGRDGSRSYDGLGLGLVGSLRFLQRLDSNDRLAKAVMDGDHLDGSWIEARNNSILAHGFQPLGENDWKTASKWVETRLRPFWKEVEPPQFPTIFNFDAEIASDRRPI